MALTAAEQYLLELINRARLDPQAEADRYGVSLNSGLSAGTIDGDSKQVLAHNSQLEQAAKAHGEWMLQSNTFSHTGANSSDPGDRIQDAGYEFSGSWTWRENLAWTGSTGNINLARAIEQHHEGLYRSAGHRANTFAEDIREVGVAQVSGKFSYQGSTFNASMLTEKFAKSGAEVYVTGVAYNDRDGDQFYSIGEGRKDVWIRVDGDREAAGNAGGYAVSTNADTASNVSIGFGSKTKAKLTIDTSDGNAKLDMVRAKNGDWMLELSGSADLESGIKKAKLLGLNDLDLSGSKRANELIGNAGDNVLDGEGRGDRLMGKGGDDVLFGGNGRDVLRGQGGDDVLDGGRGKDKLAGGRGADDLDGGAGRDRLNGNGGADRLDGGAGHDKLRGGGGADRFVFSAGKDVIRDFQNNQDTIIIDNARLDGVNAVRDALDAAQVVNGDVVMSFGTHSLTIKDFTNISQLADDLTIV